jgi:lactate racemase
MNTQEKLHVFPEENFLGVFHPVMSRLHNSRELIEQAIGHPGEGQPPRTFLDPGDRALLIVEPGPLGIAWEEPVGVLVEEIMAAGIPDNQIGLMIANGTREQSSCESLTAWIQKKHDGRVMVFYHGGASTGPDYEAGNHPINPILQKYDFCVSLSSIRLDRTFGFSGGSTTIIPGLSSRELAGSHAWESALRPAELILAACDTPSRARAEEILHGQPLFFSLQLIHDREGQVVACFAGDPILSHRRACDVCRSMMHVPIPHLADIVIGDLHSETDFWTILDACFPMSQAARKGGTLILLCPALREPHEPIAQLQQLLRLEPGEIIRMVEAGEDRTKPDLLSAARILNLHQILDEFTCVLAADCRISGSPPFLQHPRLQFEHSTEAAVEEALLRHGEESRIVLLSDPLRTLPEIAHAGRIISPELGRYQEVSL